MPTNGDVNKHSSPLSDRRARRLEAALDELLEQLDPAERRRRDPVAIPRDYENPRNRELAALVASSLAYGRAELSMGAAREALSRLGDDPAATVTRAPASLPDRLDDFRYRMTGGRDLADLLAAAGRLRRRHGSLEAAYRSEPGGHLDRASAFVGALRAERLRDDCHRGLRYLLPDPADGSACKRLHLFFRWVGRGSDGVDLGLWTQPTPDQLRMPLDTHTARISRYIGLTDRKSVDGEASRQVTRALAQLDATDPVKYDFALCHLGISEACIHERSEDHCPDCPLDAICAVGPPPELA
ncbi:MAG: TIGR02757 family protein [Bradymonadaceae bacterium]